MGVSAMTVSEASTKSGATAQELAAARAPLVNEAAYQPMPGLDNADKSKDELFVHLAFVADTMIKAHGKEFTMGALVLAARFIAEGKPLIKRKQETEATGS